MNPCGRGWSYTDKRLSDGWNLSTKSRRFKKKSSPSITFIHQVCQAARLSMKDRRLELVEKVEKGTRVENGSNGIEEGVWRISENALKTPGRGKNWNRAESWWQPGEVVFRVISESGSRLRMAKTDFQWLLSHPGYAFDMLRKAVCIHAGGAGSDCSGQEYFLRGSVFLWTLQHEMQTSPSDKDECARQHIFMPLYKGKEDCFVSGGSTFFLYLHPKRS